MAVTSLTCIMLTNPYQGEFIVLEGLDGSGQSTQAALLAKHLEDTRLPDGQGGQRTVLTKEPTRETSAGREIRRALSHETAISPERLQELFADDRREHLARVIVPALEDSAVVISDRYCFSSFAFGAVECELEWLIELNKDFLMPDLAFLLAVRPETAIKRIRARGSAVQLFETLEKLTKVCENYEAIAARFPNVVRIDAERPVPEVHEQIVEKVRGLLE